MKRCPKCKENKDLGCFWKNKCNKDGLECYCKDCKNSYTKNNLNKIRQYSKEYNRKNKVKLNAACRAYSKKHRARLSLAERERVNNDIDFKLTKRLRTRLWCAIQNEQKKGSAISELGCSIHELKIYLEVKFQEGMTWNNYGKWHIDHIKPLSKFDLTDELQVKEACHYTNLQPLWAKDNLAKSDRG